MKDEPIPILNINYSERSVLYLSKLIVDFPNRSPDLRPIETGEKEESKYYKTWANTEDWSEHECEKSKLGCLTTAEGEGVWWCDISSRL